MHPQQSATAEAEPAAAAGPGSPADNLAPTLERMLQTVASDNSHPLHVLRLGRALKLLNELHREQPLTREQLMRETQLRGRLMHGRPPRTEAEWELARELFDDEALAEFARWDSRTCVDCNPPGSQRQRYEYEDIDSDEDAEPVDDYAFYAEAMQADPSSGAIARGSSLPR